MIELLLLCMGYRQAKKLRANDERKPVKKMMRECHRLAWLTLGI